MIYKVTILGKNFNLPARTREVDGHIDNIIETDRAYQAGEITRGEAVERLHEVVETLAPGALPPLDEVDTNEVLNACFFIVDAYDAPAQKVRTEAHLASIKSVMIRPEVQNALKLLEMKKNT